MTTRHVPLAYARTDIFDHYRDGLARLVRMVGASHPRYFELLTFQQRLEENISNTRLFGDDAMQRVERNKVLHALNLLSYALLEISFNTLSGIGSHDIYTSSTSEVNSHAFDVAHLSLTAWPRFLEIDADYADRRNRLLVSIINDDYEAAKEQYWQLLYYTGTRELWLDRAFLSERLLELSDQKKDYRMSGLIQAKGQAWPLTYKKQFAQAKRVLSGALRSLLTAKTSTDVGVFYESMADIYSEAGDVAQATAFYDAARDTLEDLDAHKVELKTRFVNVRYADLSAQRRIDALLRLSQDFSAIKSYREGIVQIELARSYHSVRAPEALVAAEEAYSLLRNDVMMPTSAAKAKKLLQLIRRNS